MIHFIQSPAHSQALLYLIVAHLNPIYEDGVAIYTDLRGQRNRNTSVTMTEFINKVQNKVYWCTDHHKLVVGSEDYDPAKLNHDVDNILAMEDSQGEVWAGCGNGPWIFEEIKRRRPDISYMFHLFNVHPTDWYVAWLENKTRPQKVRVILSSILSFTKLYKYIQLHDLNYKMYPTYEPELEPVKKEWKMKIHKFNALVPKFNQMSSWDNDDPEDTFAIFGMTPRNWKYYADKYGIAE